MGKLTRGKGGRFRLYKGIRARWLVNSLGLVFMIVLVAVSAYSVAAANYYTTGVMANVESNARATSSFFSRYINTSRDEFFQKAYHYAEEFSYKERMELQFINLYGRVEISTMGPTVGVVPGTPDVQNAFKSGQMDSYIGVEPLSGERVLSVSAPLMFGGNQIVGVMRYVTSMKLVDRQVLLSTGTAMLFGIIVIIFVTGTNMYFISSILIPIQEVNEIAKKIAGGGYGARIEKKYDDEIGELTDTINNMSAEISLAERIKNDFISAVSHELRTPLTAIAGWGETLLSADMRDMEEVKKGLRIMLGETGRLTKMVEELLDFTRMEGGRMTLQVEPMDVRAEFEEVVYLYMDTLAKEGIILTYEEKGDIPEIEGDRARLRQVFLNILDNAAKHGGDGRRIDTAIIAEEDTVTVRVKDYGAGIPPEELPRVKFKFYKGSSKARGSGIGLAVSDEIVKLHSGSLNIESTVGQGTAVTVRLPLKIGEGYAAAPEEAL
ncbi:MAG: HAMP domain-containing histidine kinase [Oscillospiraceae bacterium]|jgi:signal transduction histidine kinase|nr:HAMP domain-containing histidine kinase [Oscillospiraceae bacterium]